MDKFPSLNPIVRASAGSAAILTFEPYYGLREKPFSLSTDPRFLYKSSAHSGTFTVVPDPFVTREDLLKMLLLDFGVMSVHYFPPLEEYDLRLPSMPAPSRIPQTNTPIPVPVDMTQPPASR